MSFCNKHSINNCPCEFYDKQTAEIVRALARQNEMMIKSQEDCAKSIIATLDKPTVRRRKADWPVLIAQVISVITLIAAVVIVKT